MDRQFDEHLAVVEAARGQIGILEAMASGILRCFSDGGRLYLLGNGGSAADSQHIAAELIGRFKVDRKPLPAVALTTDTSILTAVSNDFGGVHCFERQIEGLVTNRDIVWALSVSGTSENVIRAVKAAREIGATVYGFTGQSGGALAAYCGHCFKAPHDDSDRVQEVHLLGYHLICDTIDKRIAGEGNSPG